MRYLFQAYDTSILILRQEPQRTGTNTHALEKIRKEYDNNICYNNLLSLNFISTSREVKRGKS